MPAAAVIPAPIAYIKVVVVKKLVVGSWTVGGGEVNSRTAPLARLTFGGIPAVLLTECGKGATRFTLKKLECFKQASNARILVHGIME